jgi:hypothetical protein
MRAGEERRPPLLPAPLHDHDDPAAPRHHPHLLLYAPLPFPLSQLHDCELQRTLLLHLCNDDIPSAEKSADRCADGGLYRYSEIQGTIVLALFATVFSSIGWKQPERQNISRVLVRTCLGSWCPKKIPVEVEAVDALPDRLPSSDCPAGMGATISKHVDMIKIILLVASLLPSQGKTIRPVKLDKLILLR